MPLSLIERIRSLRPLVPPDHLIGLAGDGDYVAIGRVFLKMFIDYAGLREEDRVLDVGCGIGRIASALTPYLGRKGSYEGFDIMPHAIEWCSQEITKRHPNFNFRVADIHNTAYNPDGKSRASDFRFPYDDASFDLVFSVSVFTHLLPEEAANYLSEIGRVVRPGGRAFNTFFLLNEDSLARIGKGEGDFDFRHEAEGYRTTNPAAPEEAIALYDQDILDLHRAAGLSVKDVHYGRWCGRAEDLFFQDAIFAVRPA